MRIFFHGTNKVNALSILKTGFNVGTYFSFNLEDALALGGNYVFEVALDQALASPDVTWQFHTLIHIPADRIVACSVIQQETIYNNPDLRREVFEANANGSVSGLVGKIEYEKWTINPVDKSLMPDTK